MQNILEAVPEKHHKSLFLNEADVMHSWKMPATGVRRMCK
jgi:hypothetical protein